MNPGSSPATYSVRTRWRDIDGLGHVHHAIALTYLEEGRDAFLAERGIGRDEYVVGRAEIEWREEIDPGQDEVTVECEVDEVGGSSLRTSERILAPSGGVAVAAKFGIVLWDSEARRSRPLTDSEREAFA